MRKPALLLFCLVLAAKAYSSPVHISRYMFARVLSIAAEEGIPASVAVSLMLEESEGNPSARGPLVRGYRARGLFQLYMEPGNLEYLLRSYWTARGHRTEDFQILNPEHNALVGLAYLASLHARFHSWERALWYYNYGDVRHVPQSTKGYAKRIIESMNESWPWEVELQNARRHRGRERED
jgi:soluble lytic murein transglycosylase-like protein